MRKTIRDRSIDRTARRRIRCRTGVAQDDEVVIGYSAPGLVGAQLQIQQGLVDGAEAKGWTVQTTTSDGDARSSSNDINDYIAQGVDAIVAVPDDSAGICVAVAERQDAGHPVLHHRPRTSGCAINMTVLSDNFLAGQQSGEAVVAYLTEKYGEPTGTRAGDHRQHGPERGPAARWWLPGRRRRQRGHRPHHPDR